MRTSDVGADYPHVVLISSDLTALLNDWFSASSAFEFDDCDVAK
jgi:hypothetical protein